MGRIELTATVDTIGLSARSANALRREGIHTVADMLLCTEDSLKEVRNLGRKSIDEILAKIEECKTKPDTESEAADLPRPTEVSGFGDVLPKSADYFSESESGRAFVLSWLQEKGYTIDSLDTLPSKAYNLLIFNGFHSLSSFVFKTDEELMELPKVDIASAYEIRRACNRFLRSKNAEIWEDFVRESNQSDVSSVPSVFELISIPEYHDVIQDYVRGNDKNINELGLSVRSLNCLKRKSLVKMSDILFVTEEEISNIRNLGSKSAAEIQSAIHEYLKTNEKRILAVCKGGMSSSEALEEAILSTRENILKLYEEMKFGGLSLNEMKAKLNLPLPVDDNILKKIIGKLLADGELEYVDFRCYRVYPKFSNRLDACPDISEQSRDLIRKRLQGLTLEEIAQEYGLTRERVRQIVRKGFEKVCKWHTRLDRTSLFDEDYYRYFYTTYAFDKKDALRWFGMTTDIYNYLDMTGDKKGSADLESALEDSKGLDYGLRLKIKNYLNRNKLFIDGMWVEKRRSDIEEVVVRKFCRDDVSFDEFTSIYNQFLEDQGVPYDEELYYTDRVCRTRKNRLSDAHFLLWKKNEQMRYYDIDGCDYTELLDKLNIASYENIELSTLKFVEECPEILAKFDIRDEYELHNMLRKILEEGSYHDFHCGRMPTIKFGTFKRDEALLELLMDNAPISLDDFCTLIHNEYGYDRGAIAANYLKPFAEYYHQGVYTVDQKAMTFERQSALMKELPDDFYYIDEIRKKYAALFSDADLEEINPYNLKQMGFGVYSRYVVKNYPSMEEYCRSILTREDIIDITAYRKRLACISSFSQTLLELKRDLQIVEFEPNQIINIRLLERKGITVEALQDFCDEVYAFVPDGEYFNIRSVKQDGFDSELFSWGFEDCFYTSLIMSDSRFSSVHAFGAVIFYKGDKDISTGSFEESRINEYESIDIYDLMTELTNRYGCPSVDRRDVIDKVKGTVIYFDKILERFYASYSVYDRELDRAEGI